MQKLSFPLNPCLRVAGVYCCGAFGALLLLLFSGAAWKEQCEGEKNTTTEEKKQL